MYQKLHSRHARYAATSRLYGHWCRLFLVSGIGVSAGEVVVSGFDESNMVIAGV